jgi:hypothetical protein
MLAGALVVAACGGGDGGNDGGNGTPDPGPNPTASDPGPNPTEDAPATVHGALTIDATNECFALATGDGALSLAFADYSLADRDGPALVADDDGRVLARTGDELVVTGDFGAGAPDACGAPFTVESLNSVLPG